MKKGLYRVRFGGHTVLWIPAQARDLQVRLMVCAHMKDAGHRGAVATLQRLSEFCCWSGHGTPRHGVRSAVPALHGLQGWRKDTETAR